MAEARNAIDLYYLQKQGFQITGVEDGYFTLTVSVPYPSTFFKSLILDVKDIFRNLKNLFWPAPFTAVLGIVSGLCFSIFMTPRHSKIHNNAFLKSLISIDSKFCSLSSLYKFCDFNIRLVSLVGVSVSVLILCLVTFDKILLRGLLNFKGWLYQPANNQTSKTISLWGFTIRLLSRKTNLTYCFSFSLPTLPLPNLKLSIKRYLESVEPILTPNEYQQTEHLANEFINKKGKKLQVYLYFKWFLTRNYVAHWWERYVYLKSRTPLVVNSNYYIMDSMFRPTFDQNLRASEIIYQFLRFKDLIENQELEPILIKNTIPLCMKQYSRMFGTCRVPGREYDSLRHNSCSRHIVVVYRGEYFKINVYHGVRKTSLKLYTSQEILQQIIFVKSQVDKLKAKTALNESNEQNKQSERHSSRIQSYSDLTFLRQAINGRESKAIEELVAYEGSGIAALTSSPRSSWAEIREVYFSRGVNRASLREIERAAFVVSLESEALKSVSSRARSLYSGNGYNRFFDKSLTLVVYKDGYIGLNTEHSWADAPVVAHLWEFALLEELRVYQVQKHSEFLKQQQHQQKQQKIILTKIKERKVALTEAMTPIRLTFEINEDLKRYIQQAALFCKRLCQDVDLEVIQFDEYGQLFMKANGFSPDAFVQLALQLAYYRQHKRFDLTYESSMTRLFYNGRTETIRSLTKQSKAWVLAMEKNFSALEIEERERVKLKRLLKEAADKHFMLSKQAMAGQGIDRHLFALYIVCRGFDIDSAFLDQALSIPWRLSTSQQPQKQTDLRKYLHPEIIKNFFSPGGGFGPVADDGYGVSYLFVNDNTLFFHINSKYSAKSTDSKLFARNVKQALSDMQALLKG